jgi:hypothetical protein
MTSTPRQFKEMVKGDDPQDVVNRLAGYLEIVERRGHTGQLAVASFRGRLQEHTGGIPQNAVAGTSDGP